jgi:hypothetical protein
VTFETISRTNSEERLFDELIISFTHTIDWMLPGVEPTCKPVNAVFVVIVGIEDGKVSYEHIHRDQASVLAARPIHPEHLRSAVSSGDLGDQHAVRCCLARPLSPGSPLSQRKSPGRPRLDSARGGGAVTAKAKSKT